MFALWIHIKMKEMSNLDILMPGFILQNIIVIKNNSQILLKTLL